MIQMSPSFWTLMNFDFQGVFFALLALKGGCAHCETSFRREHPADRCWQSVHNLRTEVTQGSQNHFQQRWRQLAFALSPDLVTKMDKCSYHALEREAITRSHTFAQNFRCDCPLLGFASAPPNRLNRPTKNLEERTSMLALLAGHPARHLWTPWL